MAIQNTQTRTPLSGRTAQRKKIFFQSDENILTRETKKHE